YRGHNLFWPNNSPSWFQSYMDLETRKEFILNYITKVLDYYKDEENILYWDVINESVEDDSTSDSIKLRTGKNNEFLGWDTYTEDIFTIAREHTKPNVKLFYNDYNAENNNGNIDGKTGAVYNYIKAMIDKNVPIDGVGLQMHISCNYYPNYSQLYELITKYQDIGVEVHVTEIDVSMENCETHEDQRKIYSDVFKACFDHVNCKVFTVWGAYDS
ncbi:glycoside hydrolase, partial [Anaeromyces robustus]